MAEANSGSSESSAIISTVIVFYAIALYNVIELSFIIWAVFKRHSGIYFWSFVAATYGILVNSIAALFISTGPQGLTNNLVYVTFAWLGWVFMVNGQSMVLWSRLHLLMRDPFKLRLILYLIIMNAVVFQVPTVVLGYGATAMVWTKAYSVFEKIQVTVFFLQEVFLSLIYIYETIQLGKALSVMRNIKRSRQLRNHLIAINVAIILLDIGILALEYANQFYLQSAYKAFVYSAKLKMEFRILNRLVEMTTGQPDESSGDWAISSRRESSGQSTAAVVAPIANNIGPPGIPRAAGAPPKKSYRAQGDPVQPIPSVRQWHPGAVHMHM